MTEYMGSRENVTEYNERYAVLRKALGKRSPLQLGLEKRLLDKESLHEQATLGVKPTTTVDALVDFRNVSRVRSPLRTS